MEEAVISLTPARPYTLYSHCRSHLHMETGGEGAPASDRRGILQKEDFGAETTEGM